MAVTIKPYAVFVIPEIFNANGSFDCSLSGTLDAGIWNFRVMGLPQNTAHGALVGDATVTGAANVAEAKAAILEYLLAICKLANLEVWMEDRSVTDDSEGLVYVVIYRSGSDFEGSLSAS